MVDTPRTLSLEKQMLEERLAQLTEEFYAINSQLKTLRDNRDRIVFQRQLDETLKESGEVEAKLKQVETKLNQLENPQKFINQNYLDIKQDLPKIDFREAIKSVEEVINKFGKEGGGAFFILENTFSMAGELCITRSKEILSTQTRDFRSYPIQLTSESRLDELGLLKRIGDYFNVDFISDSREYALEIANTICQSLQSGSVVLLEINKWEDISNQRENLQWLLKYFWTPLVQQLQIISQDYRRFKVVILIDSENELDPEFKALDFYCKKDDFDSKKILQLPLNIWTKEDIQNWLECYSGFTASQIDFKAKQIYSKTMNGIPKMVCDALEKELTCNF